MKSCPCTSSREPASSTSCASLNRPTLLLLRHDAVCSHSKSWRAPPRIVCHNHQQRRYTITRTPSLRANMQFSKSQLFDLTDLLQERTGMKADRVVAR